MVNAIFKKLTREREGDPGDKDGDEGNVHAIILDPPTYGHW